jgi:hypothetical protein
MTRIYATNHSQHAFAPDYATVVATRTHRWLNFHNRAPYRSLQIEIGLEPLTINNAQLTIKELIIKISRSDF